MIFYSLNQPHMIAGLLKHTLPKTRPIAATMDRSRTAHLPRFAPLAKGSGSNGTTGAPKLQGLVFDVDGTLCEPQNYMFAQMRSALGVTKSEDILEHVYNLPTPEQQHMAMESIRGIERTAMSLQVPQPGLTDLMNYLHSRGVRKGICTRNFDAPVKHLLDKFLQGHVFEPIITREFRPPKPDPAGILYIARNWGLVRESGSSEPGALGAPSALANVTAPGHTVPDASGLIMVGDSLDDMTAGRRAGCATVLLVNDVNRHLVDHEHTDLVISRLDELIDILEHGFPGTNPISVFQG